MIQNYFMTHELNFPLFGWITMPKSDRSYLQSGLYIGHTFRSYFSAKSVPYKGSLLQILGKISNIKLSDLGGRAQCWVIVFETYHS